MAEGESKRKRKKPYYGHKTSKKKPFSFIRESIRQVAKFVWCHKVWDQLTRMKNLPELSVGMQGILITTNAIREKMCVSEAYDLLNEFGDVLYGPEFSDEDQSNSGSEKNEGSEDDIEKEIAKEVKVLKGKGKNERRFKTALSGAKNVVFIECDDSVNPSDLVHHILRNVKDTGIQRTRYCMKMIPVTATCYASLNDIKKHAVSVLLPHFHGSDPQPVEFAIHFKSRNNHVLKRDDVIHLIASMVTDEGAYPHVVNLKTPQVTICVEIIKNLCCMSVVKDFYQLKQYNIQTLAEAKINEVTAVSSSSTKISKCDSVVSNADTKVSNEDTVVSNEDTRVSNEDLGVNNEDPSVSNEDTGSQESVLLSQIKETKTIKSDTTDSKQSKLPSDKNDDCETTTCYQSDT